MNTTAKNLATAVAYYNALSKQDFSTLAQYIHPDIEFIGPIATAKGKDNFLQAAKGFASIIKTLTVREKFSSENQVMLVYNFDCTSPETSFRVAALMTFQNDLIAKLEIFFDTRPFGSLSS